MKDNRVISSYKDEFRKIARENNVPVEKVNFIYHNSQTIYNPYIYEYTNYWVQITNT